eukprot:4563010-Alexandrium_andersonii.AAC.1
MENCATLSLPLPSPPTPLPLSACILREREACNTSSMPEIMNDTAAVTNPPSKQSCSPLPLI